MSRARRLPRGLAFGLLVALAAAPAGAQDPEDPARAALLQAAAARAPAGEPLAPAEREAEAAAHARGVAALLPVELRLRLEAEGGKPLSGVRVRALHRRWDLAAGAESDARGQVVLGLPPGPGSWIWSAPAAPPSSRAPSWRCRRPARRPCAWCPSG